MGRYVYKEKGNIDWDWKFGFGEQCSNLGAVLEDLDGDGIAVSRYTGDSGEFVYLYAQKTRLLEALNNLEEVECPICGEEECTKWTREMLKDLKEAAEKVKEEKLEELWFVEYD
jgi:hypothetical protein